MCFFIVCAVIRLGRKLEKFQKENKVSMWKTLVGPMYQVMELSSPVYRKNLVGVAMAYHSYTMLLNV